MKALILAAGVGKRFEGAKGGAPKCLIRVGGKTLLARHLEALAPLEPEQVAIVVGYRAAEIRNEALSWAGGLAIDFVENTEYRKGSILSLYCGRSRLEGGAVIMDADVLYHPEVLSRLWNTEESGFCLDTRSEFQGEEMMLSVKDGRVRAIQRGKDGKGDLYGEGVGFFKVSAEDAPVLIATLEGFIRRGDVEADYEQAIDAFLKERRARYVPVDDLPWIEIDFPEDLRRAEAEVLPLIPLPKRPA